tara:strand:- start:1798 stop:1953 length:156 start_codon:yes stop_codon:yes gene_type:complete
MLKTFNFYQKNSSATLSLSAETFEEAEQDLGDHVSDTYGWRCDNEEGEDDE